MEVPSTSHSIAFRLTLWTFGILQKWQRTYSYVDLGLRLVSDISQSQGLNTLIKPQVRKRQYEWKGWGVDFSTRQTSGLNSTLLPAGYEWRSGDELSREGVSRLRGRSKRWQSGCTIGLV